MRPPRNGPAAALVSPHAEWTLSHSTSDCAPGRLLLSPHPHGAFQYGLPRACQAAASEFGGTVLVLTVTGAGPVTLPATVTVGGQPCTDVRRLSSTRVQCVSPAQQQSMYAPGGGGGDSGEREGQVLCGSTFPDYVPDGGQSKNGDRCIDRGADSPGASWVCAPKPLDIVRAPGLAVFCR